MGKLVFAMMQSLDGYVDGVAGRLEFPPPGVALGRHLTDRFRGLAGALYGRRIYEIMRYWDEDRPEWDAGDHDFAAVWREQPKWVVSRTLKSVGTRQAVLCRRQATAPHHCQRSRWRRRGSPDVCPGLGMPIRPPGESTVQDLPVAIRERACRERVQQRSAT